MGNLMIGGVYPSSMGDIHRIYCGEEQCWPKVIDPRFKRFILMDNKIDKNVLLAETHQAVQLIQVDTLLALRIVSEQEMCAIEYRSMKI